MKVWLTLSLLLNQQYHVVGIYSLYLYCKWYRGNASVASFGEDTGMLERKVFPEFTPQEFIDKYDSFCRYYNPFDYTQHANTNTRPVLIRGLTDHWSAHANWTKENLLKIYGDVEFKVI